MSHHEDEAEADILDDAEIAEIVPDDDGDVPMDSDDDEGEDTEAAHEFVNDSVAYFDSHASSLFSIAAHPTNPSLFLTGGGDDVAYLWTPDFPAGSEEASVRPRAAKMLAQFKGHSDSVIGALFLGKDGRYAVTAGLDGKVQMFDETTKWQKIGEIQEVEEVNWMLSLPGDDAGIAFGASDGSVWLYSLATPDTPTLLHVLNGHTASCTAGALTTDGKYLATVSEDGTFFAWDTAAGNSVVKLTPQDARFAIEGGLYSVAISPSGATAVVGGASGEIRAIGLPHTRAPPPSRAGSGRPQAGGGGSVGGGNVGQIVAAAHAHTESVESLSFHPAQPLLASAGVDGRVVIYDPSKGFAVRKTLEGHGEAVVKVEWVPGQGEEWWLTSAGTDGTIRRWDVKTGESKVWRGHLGGNQDEGEGGVLGFVQTKERIVTAGDDGVALVFEK